MYVVLLLLALAATALLQRRRYLIVVLGVVTLYLGSQLYPGITTLARDEQTLAPFNWESWQMLSLAAFAVGWSWKKFDLARRLQTGQAVLFAGSLGTVLVGCAALVLRTPGFDALAPVFHNLLDKNTLGVGRMIITSCVFVVLYWGIRKLARSIRTVIAPVEAIGRRGLESYVILTLVQIVLPLFLHRDMPGGSAFAFGALILMYLWSRLHDHHQASRRSSGVAHWQAAVAHAPAHPQRPLRPLLGRDRHAHRGRRAFRL